MKRIPIAITFDDGPNGEITLKILNLLSFYKIKATFFVLGKNVNLSDLKTKAVIGRMIKEGHVIGNHSWFHKTEKISGNNFIKEIEKTDALIRKIVGLKRVIPFRAPYGIFEKNNNRRTALQEIGRKSYGWTYDSEDWKYHSSSEIKIKQYSKKITDRIVSYLAQVKQPQILLFHDGGFTRENKKRCSTYEALKLILEGIDRNQYIFCNLDEYNALTKRCIDNSICGYESAGG